jgi:hypothetical protein
MFYRSPIQNEIAELQSLLSLILCPKFHSQLSEIIQKNADCNIYQDILRQALSHNSIPSLSVPYENCVELNSNTNQSVSASNIINIFFFFKTIFFYSIISSNNFITIYFKKVEMPGCYRLASENVFY